ncbi:hypothetical protein VTN02DRAFT_4040 [Thermoascus thermophilus]
MLIQTEQKRQSRRLSFTLKVQRILSLDKQGDAKQVIDTSDSPTRGTSIDVQSAAVCGSGAVASPALTGRLPRP